MKTIPITKVKCIRKGEGHSTPNYFCETSFTLVSADSQLFNDFELGEKQCYWLQYKAGAAWYIIDYCLMKMKPGEQSEFRIEFDQLETTFMIELHSFSKASETWKMTTPDKHNLALQMKTLGTNLLKEKKYLFAADKYGLALKLMLSDGCRSVPEDSHEDKITLIRMNLALCFMKLNLPDAVIYHCNNLLKNRNVSETREDSPLVIKNLYRRAWAYCQINEFDKSMNDISQIFVVEPNNSDAAKLEMILKNKMKASDQVMSSNLKAMFK